jgi:ABC-type microcin C transport system permease subunit YejE
MKETNTMIKAAVLVVLTALCCWILFRFTLRVEAVHQTNTGYIVEVSALGGMEIHECSL